MTHWRKPRIAEESLGFWSLVAVAFGTVVLVGSLGLLTIK